MALSRSLLACVASCALALVLVPSLAESQWTRSRSRSRSERVFHDRTPDREITMSVGALRDQDADDTYPMAALRADWRMRGWLRSELGVSYATGTIDRLENGSIPPESRTLQLATATIGLRAELPTPWVRPYAGAAIGLVLRHEEEGSKYVRTTAAFPAGVRVMLSDRVALRGEARFRFDQRRRGGEGVRIEQTGGLSVAF